MPNASSTYPRPPRLIDPPVAQFARKVAMASLVLVLDLLTVPPRQWFRSREGDR
jgi:hypothetical protein